MSEDQAYVDPMEKWGAAVGQAIFEAHRFQVEHELVTRTVKAALVGAWLAIGWNLTRAWRNG